MIARRVNYRRYDIPFRVEAPCDRYRVFGAALKAAAQVSITLQYPRDPEVRLIGFGENSLNFDLAVWVDLQEAERYSHVVAEYNWALATSFQEEGISIAFPKLDVWLNQGLPLGAIQPILDGLQSGPLSPQ